MSGITVYVINKDGYLDCERTGDVDSVMLAIEIENTPYTLQPPPNNESRWRWVDNKWIADNTAE